MFDPHHEYDRCLAQSEAAFAAGHVEVCYHLLMAALHCAEDAGDVGRLAEVARLCRERVQSIDEHDPAHRWSSGSSVRRGTPNLFTSGAGTADATIKRLKAEELLKRRGQAPPG
jgi:hypothetical protein